MKIIFHSIIVFTIVTLSLSGCYDIRLLKEEPQIASVNRQKNSRSNQWKVSYDLRYAGPRRGNAYDALHDSLSTNGISDVKEYEKLEDDRITILVYTFEEEPTRLAQYFLFPWYLVSAVTFNIVPANERVLHRVEVHIIDPKKEFDKQIKIIHAEYVTSAWYWLYLLPSSSKVNEAERSANYQGFRRIFDRIIVEELERP